jgi:FtsP/CotA-like multicopper oxidase with cupredoxin domain
MPPIAPGDSFVAAFTPPRSGTFMYHAHMDEGLQIGSGAYGPLLVVEPGERYDAAVDRVLMFSQDGPGGRGTRPTLNGRAVPDTLELRADVAQRLRFLMMPANGAARLRLRRAAPGDSALATWRLVAKDGATAPAAQATPRPAALLIATGETYDVEVAPPAGAYALELGTPTRVFFRVPVRVR